MLLPNFTTMPILGYSWLEEIKQLEFISKCYSKGFLNDHIFTIGESMQSTGFQRENIGLRSSEAQLTVEVRRHLFCKQASDQTPLQTVQSLFTGTMQSERKE